LVTEPTALVGDVLDKDRTAGVYYMGSSCVKDANSWPTIME